MKDVPHQILQKRKMKHNIGKKQKWHQMIQGTKMTNNKNWKWTCARDENPTTNVSRIEIDAKT
jgi:hypothetical protein